jgi:hypothetical protein
MAFTTHLDSQQAREDLETIIQQTTLQGSSVYFYGLFDEKSGQPSDIDETHFRERGMTAFLLACGGRLNRLRACRRLPASRCSYTNMFRSYTRGLHRSGCCSG